MLVNKGTVLVDKMGSLRSHYDSIKDVLLLLQTLLQLLRLV